MTLVEVMFSVALVGFLFIGIWGMISTNVSLVSLCRDNETATQLLAEKLETVRLYTWENLSSNGYVNSTFYYPSNAPYFTGTVSIAQAPITESYSNSIRQVTVELKWIGNRRPQSRKMVTYVSEHGLNRYVNGPN